MKVFPNSSRLSGRAPLRCDWEPFSSLLRELPTLTARQQDEVGRGYEPYNPDWDRYLAHERAGSLWVWTARTMSGVLAGYVIWLLTRGLHNVTTKFATADLIYLAPEWRVGNTGYKLLKSAVNAIEAAADPDLTNVEINVLYEDGRVGLLLERLGFRKIGVVYQR